MCVCVLFNWMNRIESTSSQFWFLTECPLFSGIVGHFRLFLFKSLFRFLTTLFFINFVFFFFQERRIKLILWFYDLYDGEYCSFFIFILDHQTHTHTRYENDEKWLYKMRRQRMWYYGHGRLMFLCWCWRRVDEAERMMAEIRNHCLWVMRFILEII